MSTIRILIVDDHEIVREGLTGMLSTQRDFEVVGCGADGEEAVELARRLRPDVVIMDLEMPHTDGAEATRRLRDQDPDIRVLVLTAYDSDERIIDAVKAGARGYLLKGLPRQELFQAIRIVHAGGSLLQPTIATRLIARVDELTRRDLTAPVSPPAARLMAPSGGGELASAAPPLHARAGHGSESAPATATNGLLSSTVAFMFTDVRGFTALVERIGEEAAHARLAEHERIVREEVARHHGTVVKGTGDGFMCVFVSVRQALRAAVAIQSALAARPGARAQPAGAATASGPAADALPGGRVQIGIGIDAGEPVERDGDYYGSAVNFAARLCGRARGGQIIVSDTVRNLIRVVEGARYHDLGWQPIKGYSEEFHLFLLDWQPDRHPNGHARHHAESTSAPGTDAVAGEQPEPRRQTARADHDSLSEAPLIGREADLERLKQELEAVAAGRGRTVLICGEPGIGKSRLAAEVLVHAERSGCRVAVGHCYQGQSVPYLPFVEALRQSLREVPPQEVERIAGVAAVDLVKLLPELGYALPHLLDGPALAPQDNQLRLWECVAQLAARAARERPTVILLEDLQWADHASLQLLQYLARNNRDDRLLLLGTYRDDELGRQHPLAEVLASMNRERLFLRLPLKRLSEPQTRALMAGLLQTQAVPERAARLVHQLTQGTPYIVEEVVRTLVEDGAIRRAEDAQGSTTHAFADLAEVRIPQSIRDIVDQRLNRLDAETLDVLRVAAVIGPTFTFDTLQVAAERDEDSLLAAIEHALEAHLIEEVALPACTGRATRSPDGRLTAGGAQPPARGASPAALPTEDAYRFVHAAVRQTLYDELSRARRRRLHARVASGLARLHAARIEEHAGEIANHYAAAEDRPAAIEWALRAATRASRIFAHAEAAAFLAHALALLDPDDRERAADLLERLGEAHMLLGDWSPALAHLNRALREREALGDQVSAARIERQLALMHQRLRFDFASGDQYLRRALGRLEHRGDEPELARAWIDLARVRAFEGFGGEAERYARQGLALAQRVGTCEDVLAAAMELGLAYITLCEWSKFDAVYEQARRLAEESDNLPMLARMEMNIAAAAWFRGRVDQAVTQRLGAVALTERLGSYNNLWYALAHTAVLLWETGRWGEAEACALRALDLAGRAGQAIQPLGWVVDIARGNWADAVVALERSLPPALERRDMQNAGIALQFLSDLSLRLDRLDASIRFAKEGLTLFRGLDYPLMLVDFPPRLAEALTLAGRVDDAERFAGEALEAANRLAVPDAAARARRALGLVRAVRGELAEGEALLREAGVEFDRLRNGFEAARTFELRARYTQSGEGSDGAALLAAAAARYASLPAPRELERLRARAAS